MTVERSDIFPSEKPPEWWHNALRNNLPGNMVNENKFTSTPKDLVDGYSCLLVSVISSDPESPMPEGVYFVTDIPEDKVQEVGDMTPFIGELFSEPFSAELSRMYDDVPDHDITIDYHPFMLYGRFCMYLLPAKPKTPELDIPDNGAALREMESSMDRINEKVFSGISEAEKIKLLFDPTYPEPLKRRFLEVELVNLDRTIRSFISEGLVTRETLKRASKNKKRQDEYKSLMRAMANHKTPEERAIITSVFARMNAKKYVGWVHFYIRYWDKKYGLSY